MSAPKSNSKRKNGKSGRKNNSMSNVSNTGLNQANTYSGKTVSKRTPGSNIDSRDIIRAINELKNDNKGHNDCLK